MKTSPHSRRASWLLILFLCAGSSGLLRAEDEIEKAFRDALYAEEVKGDSEAALKAYQEVGKKFEAQRDLAATALFRQGECLRKLGRKEEAGAIYNKVLALYGDRERVAKLSRENLVALGLAPADASAPAATSPSGIEGHDAKELARLKTLAENSPDLLNEHELAGAAGNGSPFLVSWILEKLPKPLSPAALNMALNNACDAGHLKVCQVLLDAGANPNGQGKMIPFWTAVRSKRLEVMKLLLSRKADVNVRRGTGYDDTGPQYIPTQFSESLQQDLTGTNLQPGEFWLESAVPLMPAIFGAEMDEVLDLLLTSGADPNAVAQLMKNATSSTGPDGTSQRTTPPPYPLTALGAAILNKDEHAVRRLIEAKADVNKPFGYSSNTPLVFALLMQAPDGAGQTPDREKLEKITQVLVDAGADWKAAMTNGAGALHVCARLNLIPRLEQAIKAGADVNAQDKNGNTALHHAVRASSPDGVRLLLAAGAKADPEGNAESLAAPLTIACAAPKRSKETLDIVRQLLEAGADPNRNKVKGGAPALTYASGEWFNSTVWNQAVDLLIERGARPADSGLLKNEAWRQGGGKPRIPEEVLETFRKVWKAAHWRDNPQLGHAVWLSRAESMMQNGKMPEFAAVLGDKAAVSRPPTLREFFNLAPLNSDAGSSGTVVTLWDGVEIIRMREGKEERIPVDMKAFIEDPSKNDVPLQWGDVVEVPVTLEARGGESSARLSAEKRIFAETAVELRVQPAKDRAVANDTSGTGNLLRVGVRTRGEPAVALTRDVLRMAGIDGMLFDGSGIVRDGLLVNKNSRIQLGDVVVMTAPMARVKPEEGALLADLWLCQSPDGPHWKVPLRRTVEDKPAPLAGLIVALLGPHPLPSACFDWDKATVRWFGPPPAPPVKNAEAPKRARDKEKDKDKEAPPPASVWNEKKLLEAWPELSMQAGMVITLPPMERDSFEPPAKLRTALTSALALDWTAINERDEDIPCRYEPRFFRGAKKDGLWVWRDIDPAKSSGPLLPVVFDLMAAQPRSGFAGNGRMFIIRPDGEGSQLNDLELWLTGSGTRLKFPW